MKSPILGGHYVARSVTAADNRAVNLFPEIVPEGGNEAAFLTRAPGLRTLATIGTGPIRGLWQFAGSGYVVSGSELYRLASDWTATLLGQVFDNGPRVSMADNGRQLFVACGGPSYIYDAVSDLFTQITDPDFPGAVNVSFLDGYFAFNEPDSQRLWVTSLYEGQEIDALEFISAEGSPDNLVAIIVDHRELWAFGEKSVQVVYDAGNQDFPFAAIQGAFIEYGCASAWSVAKMDSSIFWLGSDDRGQGVVYRATGYSAQRVSTHAIEWQIQRYGGLSDAIGYTYQQEGHSFYVLTFPTGDATWVYDAATQEWCERAGFVGGAFVRHRGSCQMAFAGQIVIGDYETGAIHAFDTETYSDAGQPQKWLRTWRALPTGANNLNRTIHDSLELMMESGTGLQTGQGADPQVMLRWSDDGGHTWSNERWTSLGAAGAYGTRVQWHRLGMTQKTRDRVYEASGTDPVKVTIVGAELKVRRADA